jgi:Domain of Unknown Function (DUF1080)
MTATQSLFSIKERTMRRLFSAMLLLALAVGARAADEGKPNTLTPKEAADGWLLLFDGATPFGWDAEARPKAGGGALVVGGDNPVRAATTTAFLNFELHFDYRVEKEAKDDRTVKLVRDKDTAIPMQPYEDWAQATVNVAGTNVNAAITYKDEGTSTFSQSSAGFRPEPAPLLFEVPKGMKLALRNVKLVPRGAKALFNGKDLEGWKEFPGKKSKFTVTKEGWLNIKDGPGDLQTEGRWADFVLQLECISNGNHLNSGVFFRCIPGQYQQGYEAQIRNQFTKEPKQEYTLEEYDPKTHELTGKKKIKSTAVDYGTGAIYRRMPARREVAKDREWFTLTVVARGRHLATWVNGIQVVDWTDNRPLKDNARTGCRLEKGAISLQGHDPTTDLSFRNIRIADLSGRGAD